jgi:hypothetical protein
LVYWNPQEYVERTYRSLKRAWFGFKIAKKDGDHDKMKNYAEDIQKFERQLRLPVSTFSDIIKENNLDSTRQNREGSAATNEL